MAQNVRSQERRASSRPEATETADPAAPEPAPRPATARVAGRPVRYAEYGAAGGTPVVLFHGTPGSRLLGTVYDEAARERDLRLLVPDRPGFGRSPSWDGRTLADAGRITAALLDDAGVDRAGAVGFSGGGAQALAAASTTDRVTAVDLVSTAVPPGLRDAAPLSRRLLEIAATHTPRLLAGVVRGQAWLAARRPSLALSQLTADPDALPDAVARAVAADFLEGLEPRQGGFVAESRLLARPWDLPLSDLSTPVRLWHGSGDANVAVAGARRFADELGADATVLAGADHLTALLDSETAVLDRHVESSN